MTQKEALALLKLGKNVFLTGPAGSGKTYLLNQYIDYLKEMSVGVGITASTGIAATHMNGVTIHSWSGLHIRQTVTKKDLNDITGKSYLKTRINATKVLIIDEISMLSASQFDSLDAICRAFKDKDAPFGGLQIVVSGDFFQLPPIVKEQTDKVFAYESDAWKKMDMHVCYVSEQHRHDDDALSSILNDIRCDTTGEHTLEVLRTCYKRTFPESVTPTRLYTHNADVDAINRRELAGIGGKEEKYMMQTHGARPLVESLIKGCLAPEELVLKLGAVVMFVKNSVEGKYVNGTLGTIVDFDEVGTPHVETFSGDRVVALPERWSVEEDGETKAHINQIPLRLAWAITVHKSQGMSLDAAEMDLSKSFVHGLGYVALSRVRTLKGLRLMGLNEMALQIDPAIRAIDQEFQESSEQSANELNALSEKEYNKIRDAFLVRIVPSGVELKKKKEKADKTPTANKTKLLIEKELSLKEMAKERGMTEGTIIGHIEKLQKSGECPSIEHLRPSKKILKEVESALEKAKDHRLGTIKGATKGSVSYQYIRLAMLFLGE